jgi:hypothetical protein
MFRKIAFTFFAACSVVMLTSLFAFGSSHREAPFISNDPLADNTDLYVFRSPDAPNTITIIANYIPFELPEGGPNYFTFGEGIHYEIHIRNQAAGTKPGNGDDITYRFTFTQTNEDPTTFFNIRLGKQNLKTTYKCEKSIDGGLTWMTVVDGGIVPPTNIGPRSIDAPVVGLGMPYETIWTNSITPVTSGADAGTKVFCGPADDPFFVDLAGIFDLGNFRPGSMIDALAGFNCHVIALQIPIALLQKDGKASSTDILDPDFVIGVWASASRPKVTTLSMTGGKPTYSAEYVQVSRLGMPLTNEAIIPIGYKDEWNAHTPYESNELSYADNFSNPELTLYVGNGPFSDAVPSLKPLRLDTNSLQIGADFRPGKDGLHILYATNGGAGTALDTNSYGKILLQKDKPRSVDILPIFYTGVPALAPYELATGKNGNPLATGKPFINNFLPTLGDMLRLNMATPTTDRNSDEFKNYAQMGLIRAAVLGLTDATYANPNKQFIPHMDGFPNGRRLEDDITTIEMQAVGGLVLNAIGLWTDDYTAGGPNPVTPQLAGKLGWTAGIQHNDVPFRTSFPYVALPHRGSDGLRPSSSVKKGDQPNSIGIRAPHNFFEGANYPNPISNSTTLNYVISDPGEVSISVYDAKGIEVAKLFSGNQTSGRYQTSWTPANDISAGAYVIQLSMGGIPQASQKVTLSR